MKIIITKTLLLILLIQSTVLAQNKEKINEHAMPFQGLLNSIEKQDKNLLKNTFSKRMVKVIEDGSGWDEALKQFTKMFKKEYNNYKIKDFQYKFKQSEKDPNKGKLIIIFKGKEMKGPRVIKEDNSWKINER